MNIFELNIDLYKQSPSFFNSNLEIMKLRQLSNLILPKSIKNKISISKHANELNVLPTTEFYTHNLRKASDIPADIFKSDETEKWWEQSQEAISNLNLLDASGGVNPGDRKAIYHLICALQPSSVLEVGTHIGASTIHIASALDRSGLVDKKNAKFTTVDIIDVNSETKKPWLKYGAPYSPAEMIKKLQHESFVNFVVRNSYDYLAQSDEKFDFIFLDGSHAAAVVYREIPVALRLLNPNGVILLHDYYPDLKPLWSNGNTIPGPYLAVKRLQKEHPELTVLPLGNLPWATKHHSNVTSLALLVQK